MDHKPADTNPDDTTPDEEVSPEKETSFSESGFDKEPTYETGGADTDGPTPETAPKADFTLPIRQPGRSKKPLYWALMAFVVVLIAAGVAFYFLVVAKPVKETPVASTSPTPTPTKVFTAESLVEEISAHLKGTPVPITKTSAVSGEAATGHVIYSAPSYKISGKDFANSPLKSFGAGVKGDTAVTANDYKTIVAFLADHKFTQVTSQTGEPGETSISLSIYASDTIVCQVENSDLADSSFGADLTGVGCADMSSYTEAAATVEPFYTAYVASTDVRTHPEYAENLSMSTPVINDGVDGYKNASVGMNSFVGLFYQEPGKDWVYFMGTQNELSCSQFLSLKTDTLKKAFSGQTCFDDSLQTDSTVKAN